MKQIKQAIDDIQRAEMDRVTMIENVDRLKNEILTIEHLKTKEILLDEKLKNETQRKTELKESLDNDVNYQNKKQELINLKIEVKLISIDIDYMKRMYTFMILLKNGKA